MKPIIISYDCSDHDPIDKWTPDDPFDVDIWVNFTIGTDKMGGDNFLVRIVTPNNLHGKNSDKWAIVIVEYSWENILAKINRLLEESSGDDWADISRNLSSRMHWEYQDYRP
jgi:hypothetical protein